jgi:uncharacterized protein YecT (DUF1311 family)
MTQGAHVSSTAPIRPAHGVVRVSCLATVGVLALIASPALARDTTAECDDSLGQNGLTACAARLAEEADADMAVAFAKAKTAMEAIDEDVNEVRPNPAGAVDALEQSQRGWLAYREGRCIIAGFAERGGSMEPMVVSQCEEEMTRARIAELDEWAEE